MNETEKELKKSLSWLNSKGKTSKHELRFPSILNVFTPYMEDYEVHETPIGQGNRSTILLARHVPTSVFVAMKKVDLTQIQDSSKVEELGIQISNWKLRFHPCLLTNFITFVHDESLWCVCQLMSTGSCLGLIENFFCEGLEEILVATILKEVLRGIIYLHEHFVIHNNIRAEHILVDSDGDIKLCGHNDVTWMISEGVRKSVVYDFKGEPEWMAPEILAQDTGHDCKVDIYSFGMTALELVNGKTPYRDWAPLKILLNKLTKKYPSLSTSKKGLSKSFYELVAACLAKDPAKRPTAIQLLNHSFFKQARDKSYIATELVERANMMRQEMLKSGRLNFQSIEDIANTDDFTPSTVPKSPSQYDWA